MYFSWPQYYKYSGKPETPPEKIAAKLLKETPITYIRVGSDFYLLNPESMEDHSEFIAAWDRWTSLGANIFFGTAVLIFLYHQVRVLLIRDYKERYDYVNANEVNFFWYSVIALIAGLAFFANSVGTTMIFSDVAIWFYVRIFVTACFAVIAYIIFYSLVRVYYPRFVDRRLNRIRHKPRRSSAGNKMRKLKEHEEEAHLDPELWREQREVASVDYDVWLDEKTGETRVEKYLLSQHTEECPECRYFTFRLIKEEMIRLPSETESGVLMRRYRCQYCHHGEAREVVVAPLQQEQVSHDGEMASQPGA